MTRSINKIPGNLDVAKKAATLEQRRAIVLAIVGATPANSDTLQMLLASGLLNALKPWLEDVLSGSIGGVDFLLLMLDSIKHLPVNKTMVVSSGMGKLVGQIEKTKRFQESPNLRAISDRVSVTKARWQKSVKALKERQASSPTGAKKRQMKLAPTSYSSPSAKKTKDRGAQIVVF